MFVGANLCIGDHDFFQLPASAGAKVVGARIDGEPADWMIRVIQRKGSAQNYDDQMLALSDFARGATRVGAWVLLPDDATQVFLEIQLNTSGTVVPRYNLSVAIGFPYEIDVMMFENENTTTTTTATAAPSTALETNVTAPAGTTAVPSPMTRKRGIDETSFSSSMSVTLTDKIQAILNDLGGLVPIVHGVSAKSLGLLVPSPNEAKLAEIEALLRTKLTEQRTVARFAELNIKLGLGRTVAVTTPSPTATAQSSSAAAVQWNVAAALMALIAVVVA